MRFVFKTSYDQDIRLYKEGWPQVRWYLLLGLAALALPWAGADEYIVLQLAFVFTYAVAGVGLQLLSGYTGQVSLGHAAFMAVGAYACGYLHNIGVPFEIAFLAAGVIAGLFGILIGIPALRLSGIYLAIATMAFGFIIEEVAARWETVTGGNNGMLMNPITLLGVQLWETWQIYYFTLAVMVVAILIGLNLLRSPTGRAMVAIRDSEIAAQSMGVNLARTKTTAFAVSAAMTGFAGAMYGYLLSFITPEGFTIVLSIELLILVLVGGLASMRGAVLGAAFVVMLPEIIRLTAGGLPGGIGEMPGLKPLIFGLALVLVVIFEPFGLNGIWLRIKAYLDLFPLARKNMFKRQRGWQKSERW